MDEDLSEEKALAPFDLKAVQMASAKGPKKLIEAIFLHIMSRHEEAEKRPELGIDSEPNFTLIF